MKYDILITRHQGLTDFLIEEGIVPADIQTISHASIEVVKGKNVIAGNLPLSLAEHTKTYTLVDLNVPLEKRGKELNSEQVRKFIAQIKTYEIKSQLIMSYTQKDLTIRS